jgi:hypothetical protein
MALADRTDERLSMQAALRLLDEVRELVVDLDDAPINVEGDNNKNRMRTNAQRSKDLLYAAHLADVLRLEILNQYHRFKGQNPPLLEV